MKRYIIERDIPDIGGAEREALRGAAAKSNAIAASGKPITSHAPSSDLRPPSPSRGTL